MFYLLILPGCKPMILDEHALCMTALNRELTFGGKYGLYQLNGFQNPMPVRAEVWPQGIPWVDIKNHFGMVIDTLKMDKKGEDCNG